MIALHARDHETHLSYHGVASPLVKLPPVIIFAPAGGPEFDGPNSSAVNAKYHIETFFLVCHAGGDLVRPQYLDPVDDVRILAPRRTDHELTLHRAAAERAVHDAVMLRGDRLLAIDREGTEKVEPLEHGCDAAVGSDARRFGCATRRRRLPAVGDPPSVLPMAAPRAKRAAWARLGLRLRPERLSRRRAPCGYRRPGRRGPRHIRRCTMIHPGTGLSSRRRSRASSSAFVFSSAEI